MMASHEEKYHDAMAVEMSIKEAAKAAHQADPSRQINDLIRQAHYDRFLCRVFSDGEESEWVLKGGSSMLARVPNARRTQDADLYLEGYDKDHALADLRRLAAIELGDFFRFIYTEHHAILGNDLQPYADGYRVVFDAYLGTKLLDPIKVDLSAHVGATTNLTVAEPANRLPLPRLTSFAYRLYPIERQIADKVCASVAIYNGYPSSREKDLVDLVVIAVTQSVVADDAYAALHHEAQLRQITLPKSFTVPATWGKGYSSDVRNTPAASYDMADALALIQVFIDPLIIGTVQGATWSPDQLAWVPREIGTQYSSPSEP